MVRIEPRALHVCAKCADTEPYAQLKFVILFRYVLQFLYQSLSENLEVSCFFFSMKIHDYILALKLPEGL